MGSILERDTINIVYLTNTSSNFIRKGQYIYITKDGIVVNRDRPQPKNEDANFQGIAQTDADPNSTFQLYCLNSVPRSCCPIL